MSLTVWVYRLSDRLPAEEKSGLCAGMRRAATAAAQQTADADGRVDVNDAIQHYESALAALRELLTAALISQRLGYLRGRHLRALRSRLARVESLIEADLYRCLDERELHRHRRRDEPHQAAPAPASAPASRRVA